MLGGSWSLGFGVGGIIGFEVRCSLDLVMNVSLCCVSDLVRAFSEFVQEDSDGFRVRVCSRREFLGERVIG